MRANIASEARILVETSAEEAVRTTREMYREDMILVRIYRHSLE